ncbi:MAG: Coenzyme F420 hydrogenase/dehydrogenase, beta subunit C-terminal domain [Acidimicrobiales bacterium]
MSSGFSIRDEMNSMAEAPGKTWFWELEAGVIDADRCIQCGTCVAVCPSDSIGIGANGLPELVKMCTGCSLCWDFCPRGGLRYEALWPEVLSAAQGADLSAVDRPVPPTVTTPVSIGPRRPASADGVGTSPDSGEAPNPVTTGGRGEGLGLVEQAYAARVSGGKGKAQDGGVVSAVLIAALESKEIDGALLARPSPTETWRGIPFLARTPDEVLECAGSFYNQTMALGHLDLKGYGLSPEARIALVGTPCEVQGIKAMQAHEWSRGSSRVDAVALTIALLCTKSFDYEGLMLRELRDKRGLDLDQVGKVDVIHGKMIVEDTQGNNLVSEPVKDFHGAALKGCDECADFLGRAADLSVGSVGSAAGYSSVLVRTPAGAKAFDRAADRLEVSELENPSALLKLDAFDRRVTLGALKRDFDPDGPLFISYTDHAAAYAGSDRAPVIRIR